MRKEELELHMDACKAHSQQDLLPSVGKCLYLHREFTATQSGATGLCRDELPEGAELEAWLSPAPQTAELRLRKDAGGLAWSRAVPSPVGVSWERLLASRSSGLLADD